VCVCDIVWSKQELEVGNQELHMRSHLPIFYHNNTLLRVKQSHYRPRGFQEVKVPKFHENGTGWR